MSASELLTVDVAADREATVAHVRGEVDMGTASVLRDHLDALTARPDPTPLVVDLTAVRFMASAGLALLVELHHRLSEADRPLRVVVAGGPVLRALQVTSLDHVLDVSPSLDEALRG